MTAATQDELEDLLEEAGRFRMLAKKPGQAIDEKDKLKAARLDKCIQKGGVEPKQQDWQKYARTHDMSEYNALPNQQKKAAFRFKIAQEEYDEIKKGQEMGGIQ